VHLLNETQGEKSRQVQISVDLNTDLRLQSKEVEVKCNPDRCELSSELRCRGLRVFEQCLRFVEMKAGWRPEVL
jgi:hypothetical protein